MAPDQLDEVDKGIIHLLQKDARNNTTTDIAEVIDVSPSTVSNRISQLEEEDVIDGYAPKLNYERADLPLHVMFVCTAPVESQTELADAALDVFGVVDVREVLSGTRNIRAEVVSREFAELERTTQELVEVGLEIDSSEIIKQHRTRPFDQFGSDRIDGS